MKTEPTAMEHLKDISGDVSQKTAAVAKAAWKQTQAAGEAASKVRQFYRLRKPRSSLSVRLLVQRLMLPPGLLKKQRRKVRMRCRTYLSTQMIPVLGRCSSRPSHSEEIRRTSSSC